MNEQKKAPSADSKTEGTIITASENNTTVQRFRDAIASGDQEAVRAAYGDLHPVDQDNLLVEYMEAAAKAGDTETVNQILTESMPMTDEERWAAILQGLAQYAPETLPLLQIGNVADLRARFATLSDDARSRLKDARLHMPSTLPVKGPLGELIRDERDAHDALRFEAAVNFDVQQRRVRREGQRRFEAENAGPPSWARIDPDEALEASQHAREPEIGTWSGDSPLGVIYAGCVNDIHGESESGKSWLLLLIIAMTLRAGATVTLVDYEDSEGPVYRRLLLLLGALGQPEPEGLLRGDRFRYHRPNGALTDAEREAFEESVADSLLVAFDGVTEGMALEGLSPRDEAEVAEWHARTTKSLAHRGKAVAVVDHTPHGERRALGSQHKKSSITGVSYLVEAIHPVSPGQRGRLRLRVEKDRHGSIRREAAPGPRPQWRGDLVLDFTAGEVPVVGLWPAARAEGVRRRTSPPSRRGGALRPSWASWPPVRGVARAKSWRV